MGIFAKTRLAPFLPSSCEPPSVTSLSLLFIFFLSSPPPYTRPPSSKIPRILLKTARCDPHSTFPRSKQTSVRIQAKIQTNSSRFWSNQSSKHLLKLGHAILLIATSNSLQIGCGFAIPNTHHNLKSVSERQGKFGVRIACVRRGLGSVRAVSGQGLNIGVFQHLKQSLATCERVSTLESRWGFSPKILVISMNFTHFS